MLKRIGFICTGNICRSPMGEVVLATLVANDEHFRGRVEVTSAGTANWHVGREMDPRARAALDRAGFTGAGSPAAFANADYIDRQNLLVVMTREHRADVLERSRRDDVTILMIRTLLEPDHELDLADPYYGDAIEFDECLATIIRSCQELVPRLHLEVASS